MASKPSKRKAEEEHAEEEEEDEEEYSSGEEEEQEDDFYDDFDDGMDEETKQFYEKAFEPAQSGKCEHCGQVFKRQELPAHLISVLPSCTKAEDWKQGIITSKKSEKRQFFVLRCMSYGYWLFIKAYADATLEELDAFLRNNWLECCGHMSKFSFPTEGLLGGGGLSDSDEEESHDARNMRGLLNMINSDSEQSYSSSPMEDFGERSLDVKIGKVFQDMHILEYKQKIKQAIGGRSSSSSSNNNNGEEGFVADFSYEYDMGTTTDLVFSVVAVGMANRDPAPKASSSSSSQNPPKKKEKRAKGQPGVSLLARNNAPNFMCIKCKKAPAKFMEDGDPCCKKCVHDDEAALPLVNSPRTGQCGYTGE